MGLRRDWLKNNGFKASIGELEDSIEASRWDEKLSPIAGIRYYEVVR